MLNAQSVTVKTGAAPGGSYVVLLLVLVGGSIVLNFIFRAEHPVAGPHWPTQADVYTVPGWATSTPAVESAWGITHVSRTYRTANGAGATLVISTSPEAKSLYKSGADLSFLGSGYATEGGALDVVAPAPGRTAEILKRERETLLLLYTFGERRGLLGNGWLGWAMYGLDTLVGQANDYYLLRIVAPLTTADPAHDAQLAAELADTIFPRVAAWYSSR